MSCNNIISECNCHLKSRIWVTAKIQNPVAIVILRTRVPTVAPILSPLPLHHVSPVCAQRGTTNLLAMTIVQPFLVQRVVSTKSNMQWKQSRRQAQQSVSSQPTELSLLPKKRLPVNCLNRIVQTKSSMFSMSMSIFQPDVNLIAL